MRYAIVALLLLAGLAGAVPDAGAFQLQAFGSREDVTSGEVFSVAIVALNDGDAAIDGVEIVAPLPAQYAATFGFAGGACTSPCSGGRQIVWQVPRLEAGGLYVASFRTRLEDASEVPPGSVVTLTASASAGGAALDMAAFAVRSKGGTADATTQALRLSTSTTSAVPDETFAVTASFGNRSTSLTSLDNVLAVNVPAAVEVMDADGGTASGTQVSWNLGALAPGEAASRTLLVRVRSQAQPGLMRFSAMLQDAGEASTAASVVAVRRGGGLRLSLETPASRAAPGDATDVRVRVSNTSSQAMSDIEVRSRIPDGVDGPLDLADGGTCQSTCAARSDAVWTIATLPAGATRILSYADQVLTNTVSGESLRLEATAAVAGERAHAMEDLVIDGQRALMLAMTPRSETYVDGAQQRLELLVGNRGQAQLSTDTMLRLRIPPGFTVLDDDGALVAGDELAWPLGALSPGELARRAIVLRAQRIVSGGSGGSIFADGFEDDATGGGGNDQRWVTAAPLLARIDNAEGDAAHARVSPQVTTLVDRLAVRATAAPAPVRPGEQVDGEVTVANVSGEALSDVHAYMRLPRELAALGVSHITGGGGCGGTCFDGDIVRWPIGDLPAGASRTLTWSTPFDANVAPGTVVELDAWATATNGRDSTRTRDAIAAAADRGLDIAVAELRDPQATGDVLEYRITWGNRSTASIGAVTLALALPEGATFVSASDGGTHDAAHVSWPLGALAPGRIGERRVAVDVSGIATGAPLRATARIGNDQGAIAFADVIGERRPGSPLTVSVAATPRPAAPGELVNLELLVSNRGGSDQFGAFAHLRIPQGVGAIGASEISDGGHCGGTCFDGDILTWDLGDLPAGQSRRLSLVATMHTDASGALVPFDAWASSGNGSVRARARDVAAVATDRALDVALEDRADPVGDGQTWRYVARFGNRSGGAVTGAQLRLRLPVGTTLVAAPDGGSLIGDSVVWDLGALAPGELGEREARVSVAGMSEGAPLLAAASLIADGGHVAWADALTALESNAPLALTVAASPDPAMPNELVAVEVTLANTGGLDLFGAFARLRVPQALGAIGAADISGGGDCGGTCFDGDILTWDVGDLPAGASRTFTLMTALNNVPAGSLVGFDAWASATGAQDSVRAREVIGVAADRALEVAVIDGDDPVAAGGALPYVLRYSNRSVATIGALTLTLTPPDGAVPTAISDGGSVDAHGRVVWSLGSLSPGASGARTLTVPAGLPPEATLLRSDARLQADAGDAAFADAVTVLETGAALRLEGDVSPSPVTSGAGISGTLTVTNTAGVDLFGVFLTLRVPQELAAIGTADISDGGSCGGGTCFDGELLRWDLGTLAAGAQRTVTWSADVNGGIAAGTLIGFDADAVTEAAGSGARSGARVRIVVPVQ